MTDEDTPLAVAAAQGLLANDSDVDHGALLSVLAASSVSELGAAVEVNADGSYAYDATGAALLQQLAEGESATDRFAYVVTDEHGAIAFATAEISVAGVNDAPVANADAAFTFEDLDIAVDVLDNDSDVDASDTHTVDAVAVAGGLGTAAIVDNQVVYDPAGSYQSLAQGESAEVVLDYTMSDNHGVSSSSTVTITVRGANDDPDAVDDTLDAVTDEDTSLTIAAATLLANDTDPDLSDVLTIDSVSDASALGAVVSIDEDGNVVYDPTAVLQHLAAGQTRTDTFTYTVVDPFGASDTASVTLTVAGVNDAPEAENDAYTLAEGGSLTVGAADGVLTNDADADGEALSAVL